MWAECNGKLQKCGSEEDDFLPIIVRLLGHLDEEEMHLLVIVARQMWLRMNNVVFGGEFLGPAQLVHLAKE